MNQTQFVRDTLMAYAEDGVAGVPGIDSAFGEGRGGAAAAADFLGLRRGTAKQNRARSSFLRAFERYRASEYGTGRQARRPSDSSGRFRRLLEAARLAWLVREIKAFGLTIGAVAAEMTVSGDDRFRVVNISQYLRWADLEKAADDIGRGPFEEALSKGRWRDVALSITTAWFEAYTGTAGYEVEWHMIDDATLRIG